MNVEYCKERLNVYNSLIERSNEMLDELKEYRRYKMTDDYFLILIEEYNRTIKESNQMIAREGQFHRYLSYMTQREFREKVRQARLSPIDYNTLEY